jgi:transposase-like protein
VRFLPDHCPYSDCKAHRDRPFRVQRRGTYSRKCDGRRTQRFLCRECRRSFSSQRFRLDFGLHRPAAHLQLFAHFVSKVTHRQSARLLACSRKTVAHRLDLLGEHCRTFHLGQLARAKPLDGLFQLDELETFEHNRRLQPLTVPVLIHRWSLFVVDLAAAPLPCRGKLREGDRIKKAERERIFGKRRSGSRAAVERCLARLAAPCRSVVLETDRKDDYVRSVERVLGASTQHRRISSRAPRNRINPLFAINHTLAMLRDGLSRLVRRTWAASKQQLRLERHLWIWVCWRNYVRGITNEAPRVTPAMAAGVSDKRWRKDELLALKVSSPS